MHLLNMMRSLEKDWWFLCHGFDTVPGMHGSRGVEVGWCSCWSQVELCGGAAAPAMLSVQVNSVEDPLCELLQLGRRVLRLLLEPLVVLPKPFDLSLKLLLLLSLLQRKLTAKHHEHSD